MNRNSLRPLYPELSGEERFRLALRVGAAGDGAEVEHLARTGPRVEGTALDRSFADPVLASFRLASAFARSCGPSLGGLAALEVLEGLLTGGSARRIGVEPSPALALVLDRLAETLTEGLVALRGAFEESCEEHAGLPGEVLLRFWTPELARALEGIGIAADSAPDPDLLAELKAGFDQAWTLI